MTAQSAVVPTKEIEEALELLDMLQNFAYDQGFHECGYDPVKKLRSALSATASNEWRPMFTAPQDGTEIELLIHHPMRKLAKGDEVKMWEQVVRAKWIDHNSGGWTWHGMAGNWLAWRPIAQPADSTAQPPLITCSYCGVVTEHHYDCPQR